MAVHPFPNMTKKERVARNRKIGSLGGKATAAKHSKEFLESRAEKAGTAVLQEYGREFYVNIRKMRKHYPKKYRKRKGELDV